MCFFSVYIALIIMQSFSHVVFIWPTMCDVYCMHRFVLLHMYLLLSLILHLLWCTVCACLVVFRHTRCQGWPHHERSFSTDICLSHSLFVVVLSLIILSMMSCYPTICVHGELGEGSRKGQSGDFCLPLEPALGQSFFHTCFCLCTQQYYMYRVFFHVWFFSGR